MDRVAVFVDAGYVFAQGSVTFPTVVTKNRKALRPNPLARFELRIGALRVYYEVDEARRVVEIRAVGIKDRDQVIIGGGEIDLS